MIDNVIACGEGQKIGEFYERMDCMIREINDFVSNSIHVDDLEILVNQWEKMNIPMHCLGFTLNSFYYDSKYFNLDAHGGVAKRALKCDLGSYASRFRYF